MLFDKNFTVSITGLPGRILGFTNIVKIKQQQHWIDRA